MHWEFERRKSARLDNLGRGESLVLGTGFEEGTDRGRQPGGQEAGWRTGCKTGKVRVGRMHLVNKHH